LNQAACAAFGKDNQKACMSLLSNLAIKILQIIQAGEGNIALPSSGSTIDKAKAVCTAPALTAQQVQMCSSTQEQFKSKAQALAAGQVDGGFCSMSVVPGRLDKCYAIMAEINSGLKSIATLSANVIAINAGTPPVEKLNKVCGVNAAMLNSEQSAACSELLASVRPKLKALNALPPAEFDMTLPAGPKSPKPAAKPQQAATGSTGGATAAAEVATAVASPASTGPASTGKARAFCDEVPEVNVEACKKFIVNLRYTVRAIAEKAGMDAAPMEKGKTASAFMKAVCDTVKGPSEVEECSVLLAKTSKDKATLMAGPVGPEFTKVGGATGPAKAAAAAATGSATGAAAAGAKKAGAADGAMAERAKVCTAIAKTSETDAKTCDAIIKGAKAKVSELVAASGKTPPTPKATLPALDKLLSVCEFLGDANCAEKVSEGKAKVATLKAAADAKKQKIADAKKVATLLEAATQGSTGATGGATGAAAVAPAKPPAVAKAIKEAKKAAKKQKKKEEKKKDEDDDDDDEDDKKKDDDDEDDL